MSCEFVTPLPKTMQFVPSSLANCSITVEGAGEWTITELTASNNLVSLLNQPAEPSLTEACHSEGQPAILDELNVSEALDEIFASLPSDVVQEVEFFASLPLVDHPSSPVEHMETRQTRSASHRQTKAVEEKPSYEPGKRRRRNPSEHSVASSGSVCYLDSGSEKPTRKRRQYEQDPSDDPEKEKKRKNALGAKLTREKQKQKMEELNSKCDSLASKNQWLNSLNQHRQRRIQELEQEVQYLKKVLSSQSALASVLSVVRGNLPNFHVTTSSQVGYNNYTDNATPETSGGLCLHVDGNQVSIEMCSKCAQMSRAASRYTSTHCQS